MPIVTVNSTDTPNAGRIAWNANDTLLQSEIDAVNAALATHETSADHDSRYYTKSYIDAQIGILETDISNLDAAAVKLTGDQTIAGEKTFSDDMLLKKASPVFGMSEADDSVQVRATTGIGNGYPFWTLQIYQNSIWQYLMSAYVNDDKISFGRRVFTNDGELATQEYVQTRVKTGNFILSAAMSLANVTASGTSYFKTPEGGVLRFLIPASCRLQSTSLIAQKSDNTWANQRMWVSPYTFSNIETNTAIARLIVPRIVATLVSGSIYFNVYLDDLQISVANDGSVTTTTTQIFTSDFTNDHPIASGNNVDLFLALRLSV